MPATNPENRNMPEMLFDSVKSAVQWSEEFCSRPDLGSQIGKLFIKPDTGTMTREELIDIAHTISLVTANCKPFKGMAMKSIYGEYSQLRDYQLGCIIGGQIWNKHQSDPQRKPIDKMHRLGQAVIKAERALEIYDDRYPLKRMAHEIGVSRQQFTQSVLWPQLLGEARDLLRTWMNQAEGEIRMELIERGWMV